MAADPAGAGKRHLALGPAPPSRRPSIRRQEVEGPHARGAVFAAEIKPHLVHETVRAELNARRAGTHAAKTRGFVAGGRAKPWRQKGTGRARAGHDPRAAVHGRRRRVPADAAQLRGQGEQEGAPGRAARRAVRARRQAARSASSRTTSFEGAVHAARRPSCSAPGARTCRCSWSPRTSRRTSIKSFRNLPGVYVVTAAETRGRRARLGALACSSTESALERCRGGPGNGVSLHPARSCSLRSCPRRATA